MSDRAAWFRREAVSSGTPNPSLGQSWRDYVLRNPEAAAVIWANVMNERIARGMPPPVSTDFDSGYSLNSFSSYDGYCSAPRHIFR